MPILVTLGIVKLFSLKATTVKAATVKVIAAKYIVADIDLALTVGRFMTRDDRGTVVMPMIRVCTHQGNSLRDVF